jgi:hypothetical protein
MIDMAGAQGINMTTDEKTTLRLVAAYRAARAAVETSLAESEANHERLPGLRGDPAFRAERQAVGKRNEKRRWRYMEAVEASNNAWRELQQHM